jgi:hypothetical protein
MSEPSFNEALKEAYPLWRRSPALLSVGLLHQAIYGLSSSFPLALLFYLLRLLSGSEEADYIAAKISMGQLGEAIKTLFARPELAALAWLLLLGFAALWVVGWALAYALEYPGYAEGLRRRVALSELASLARAWRGRILITNAAYELVASSPLLLLLPALLLRPDVALPFLLPALFLSLLLRWALAYTFPACVLDGATGFGALRLGLRALRRLMKPSIVYALTRGALFFLLLTVGLSFGFLREGGFIVVALLYCPLISLVHYCKVLLYLRLDHEPTISPQPGPGFAAWLRRALPKIMRRGAEELASPGNFAYYAAAGLVLLALYALLLPLLPPPGIDPAELAGFPGIAWGLSLYVTLSGLLLLLPSLPALLLGLQDLASSPYPSFLKLASLLLLTLSLAFGLRLAKGVVSGGAGGAYRAAFLFLLISSIAYFLLASLHNVILPALQR